jgi:glycosyltransferase involved in cell wall biosynthesis
VRILSVVTLVSPTGEYGGPVRVAVNQARALREQGHEVTIAGAARGFDGPLPTELDGVPASLFPARTVLPGVGFAGLAAPRLRSWIATAAREADVVHVHLARDLVTLPAARAVQAAGVPLVVQTHGMIDPSGNPLAHPLDALWTKPVLRKAAAVLFLTPVENAGLRAVAGDSLRLVPLGNGVPASRARKDDDGLEVLYLARLAPRKRPELFVAAAERVAPRFPEVRFRLVGPDEGRGDEVNRLIGSATADIRWEGPIDPASTDDRMARASVYVLPAVDEPYPMSVLEAMAAGVPVIVTDTCGLAPAVSESGSGIVVDAGLDALTAAITTLLDDPALRRRMGETARRTAEERFSMPAIARDLLAVYRRAAGGEAAGAAPADVPRPLP